MADASLKTGVVVERLTAEVDDHRKGYFARMVPSDTGGYVRWTDYTALQRELTAAEKRVAELSRPCWREDDVEHPCGRAES